jgi:hypothetical protein
MGRTFGRVPGAHHSQTNAPRTIRLARNRTDGRTDDFGTAAPAGRAWPDQPTIERVDARNGRVKQLNSEGTNVDSRVSPTPNKPRGAPRTRLDSFAVTRSGPNGAWGHSILFSRQMQAACLRGYPLAERSGPAPRDGLAGMSVSDRAATSRRESQTERRPVSRPAPPQPRQAPAGR